MVRLIRYTCNLVFDIDKKDLPYKIRESTYEPIRYLLKVETILSTAVQALTDYMGKKAMILSTQEPEQICSMADPAMMFWQEVLETTLW